MSSEEGALIAGCGMLGSLSVPVLPSFLVMGTLLHSPDPFAPG